MGSFVYIALSGNSSTMCVLLGGTGYHHAMLLLHGDKLNLLMQHIHFMLTSKMGF